MDSLFVGQADWPRGRTVVALLATLSLSAHGQEAALDVLTVTASGVRRAAPPGLGAINLSEAEIAATRAGVADSSQLLRDVPGMSMYGAGGISGLPAIRGMADERLRIQVDGADLMAACPNHMNPVLSYIAPSKVAEITVYPGVAPVSVGGDNIGGVIQVRSAPPLFAGSPVEVGASGTLGTYYHSNGHAVGYNAGVEWVGQNINLSYSESQARSGNYRAGGDFKPVAKGREDGAPIAGDVVASSGFAGAHNREVGLALRQARHVLQLTAGEQQVEFEGFPNQRMDMTNNRNTVINLRYFGDYDWGAVEARLSDQDVRHRMDMGRDRYSYGTGMPMESKAHTRNGALQATINPTERDLLRLGGEYQSYILYDWWPPVGGVMAPNAFWNVDYGRRHRSDVFGEWEAHWQSAWTTLIGVRGTRVTTDAAAVQGYDNGLAAAWGNDAAAFNGRDRKRADNNWDFTALARFVPDRTARYEGGYARKSRAPSLYQRYPWSTNPMAALMNNFVGDGNGYVGNPDLRPEVAHTVSLTGDWNGPQKADWSLKATAYYTYVEHYIDAQRCDSGQCSAENLTRTDGFVHLKYANQRARLYGIDLAGAKELGHLDGLGSFSVTGLFNYVRGENTATGDNLYNMMPPNAKLALRNRAAGWTSTAEMLLVKGKRDVSEVRNEIPTAGYGLLNLRSSYQWTMARLDVGIENLFDKRYALPLGGAYVGQGASMTTGGVPWGYVVPGRGRSVNVALNLNF
ncbi:TonB-dependent receptor [Zoogloea sp.]|uniref:TonB-dependent receptor n=1 Tax=Zoogloea sp. TaxID=49181 RepID=UPI0035B125AF